MANDVLLNNIDHKDLKVITRFGEKYGDKVWHVPTFPLEFRTLQAEYPIMFQKSAETGQFYPVVLLGFEQGENLYLEGETWNAGYVPLMIKRQPFLIGAQRYTENGEEKRRLVIHIDLDNPRVSEAEGQQLFEDFGANSPYLDQVASMLEAVDVGMQSNHDFMQQLLEFDLIESVTLDIELNNGSRNSLVGFYTIQEDHLNALSAEQINTLHTKGYLQAIYMVMASQSNISKLVDFKNKAVAQ
ncbi:MAG: SapC family protein [Glaciecola sp.]